MAEKSLVKSAGIIMVSHVIGASIPFLLLPVLTNYLSTAEYGIISNYQFLIMLTIPLLGSGIMPAISRQYVRDGVSISRYIGNAAMIFVALSLIVLALFSALSPIIEEYAKVPSAWIWTVIVYALMNNLSEALLTLWRMQSREFSFGIFRIARTAIEMSLSIYLVVSLDHSWEGRAEGQLMAYLLFGLIALFILRRQNAIDLRPSEGDIKHALRFGMPLILHVIGGVIIGYSDKLFITNMVGIEANGVYSAAFQVGMVISLLQNSFNMAWVPWFYKRIKENTLAIKLKIVRFNYIYNLGLIVAVFIATWLAPYAFKLLGQDFSEGLEYFFWIALGFAFNGMYKMVCNYLFYIEKTFLISMVTLLTAGINMLLNYYLIQIYGVIGAAYASAAAFFIQFVLVWIASARLYPMPWFSFYRR